MQKYFLYARKSTESEDRQVLSIEGQLTELRAFAKQQELFIADEFIEKQSSRIPGRPIFNAMMSRIESGEATGILAWHPDRLARNSIDGGRIIHLLDTNTLRALKFPQFWFEPTPQGKFMLNIAFGQSKYYVDSLAENTKRGLRQKVRRGEYPGPAPVGYLNDIRTKSIVIDKKRAAIIAGAFELYAKNQSRLEDVSNFLAQHGVTTCSGKRRHYDQITSLLSNPFYYGHFRYSGEVHEGKHPPLISKKLFDQVQDILKDRGRPRKIKNGPQPFCGLITCAFCDLMVTAEFHIKRQKNGNEHRYVYYRCSKKRTDVHCLQPCIRQEELDRQLSTFLASVSLRPDWAAIMRQLLAEDEAKSAQSVATFITDARAQIKQIDSKLQRLLDGYLEQDIDKEDYRAQKAALLSVKKTLQEQSARLQKEQTGWVEPLRTWIEEAETITEIATGSDLALKRAAAKKIFGLNLCLSQRTLLQRARSAPDFAEETEPSAWTALRAASGEVREDSGSQIVVAESGVEPERPCGHWILSPARLPVPPLGRVSGSVYSSASRAAKS